jgi:mannose-6-phosphate isomerase
MTELGILPLVPQYHHRVWGGTRLQPSSTDATLIGEAWLVGEASVVGSGPHQGQTVAALTQTFGAGLIGEAALTQSHGHFPLLIKLLDCQDWLSVQVHPDDDLAHRLAGPEYNGKTEAWHILEAQAGATLIAGVRPGVDLAALQAGIAAGDPRNLLAHLAVHPGDSVLMPAGTVHALGPGLFVYEVQQHSDITYRVYDWGRPSSAGRALHLPQSLAAAKAVGAEAIPCPTDDGTLVTSQYFVLERLTQPGKHTTTQSFHALTVVEGCLLLTSGLSQATVEQYKTVLLPASLGNYRLEGEFVVLRASVVG